MRSTLVIAAFALSSVFAVAAEKPALFQFTAEPGPYPVGLRVVNQYDYSRIYHAATDDLGKPYSGERSRPIQTLIWYPAKKAAGKAMTVSDYVELLATETSFGKPNMADVKEARADVQPALDSQLHAFRDAAAEDGRFPVVIYAPSFSASAFENADLCEYLASFGYVVIASPDRGATTRDMTADLVGINAQARDISFLIGYAQSLADTDMSKIAVGGFSWGGVSNLFAAARDNRIDALFAWDGSMRYYPGLVRKSGDVHPEEMAIPMIFFTQGEFTLEDQVRYLKDLDAPNVLNAWTHGDLTTVHMLGMVHGEFSSGDQRSESFWKGFDGGHKADYGRADGSVGYTWAAHYTLQFLNAYLKGDAAGLAYLKKTPAENGVPPHFMATEYRAAKGAPATMEALRAEVGRRGFDHAAEVYEAMHKENASFKPDEGAMEGWGHELEADNHLPEATELLKLNVQLYPESGNAYASLGEVYEKSGQKPMAIEEYKKALEKDPGNTDVSAKLKALESQTVPKQ